MGDQHRRAASHAIEISVDEGQTTLIFFSA